MESDLWRGFAKVAGTGSFTAASEELPISQSGLSQQVRRLERLLGVSLFERDSRNVTLTEVGQQLLPLVHDLLAAEDALLAAARAGAGQVDPITLRVFVSEDGTGSLLIDIVNEIRNTADNVRVEVVQVSIAGQGLALGSNGARDALIERTPTGDPTGAGRRTKLRTEPMCLVAPADLALGESITVAEAGELPVRPMDWLPDEWLQWFPLLRGTTSAPDDVLVVGSFRSAIQSVALESRCCIAPLSIATTMSGLGNRIVPISDAPAASLDLVTIGDDPLLEVLHTTAAMLAEPLEEIIAETDAEVTS